MSGFGAAYTPSLDDTIEEIGHIPKFTGEIWFVDGTGGSDSNAGDLPHAAFATIGAITSAAAGDAIIVKTGTYDENGLDLNDDGLELLCEIGTLIMDTTTGTQTLLVSGNYCRVSGLHIEQSGQIGIKATGTHCQLEKMQVQDATVAYDIDGALTQMAECHDINATTTGFDIGAEELHMHHCSSIGSGGAPRGFYLSNSAAKECIIHDCISLGNGTAGYEVVAGATSNTFKNCSSGSGDGNRVDPTDANVWTNYEFDDKVYYTLTFDTTNGTSENLFQVTGSVEIIKLLGDVETALNADIGNSKLELWDGTASVNITDTVDISFAPVGSVVIKQDDANLAMTYIDASAGRVTEPADPTKPPHAWYVTQKTGGVATYIRFNFTGDTSGVIHFHCQWLPLTEDGFVEAA